MDIYKRIAQVIGDMSHREFAELVGETEQRVKNIMSGRTAVPTELLVKLHQAQNVDLNWLLTGEGSPGQALSAREAALLSTFRSLEETGKRAIEHTGGALAGASKKAGQGRRAA